MKCLRIYATPDGESHFGDADIAMPMMPLFPNETPFGLSAHYPASRIRFVHVPAGVCEVSWHRPPERVLAVWLDGIVEFETSDREVRQVSAGGFVLVEDTQWKGPHLTSSRGGAEHHSDYAAGRPRSAIRVVSLWH